ncbi:MAG: hypothetical protein AAF587_01360 [Bacteroidota bacterium]
MKSYLLMDVSCLPLMLSGWLVIGCWGCSLMPVNYTSADLYDGYQLVLPDYLERMEGLVDDADLQYGNPYKEFYLICHYQTWEELNQRFQGKDLETFYDFHVENLLLSLQETEAPAPDSIQIGGFGALDGHLEGLYKGDKIHYRLVVVDLPEGLIQMLVWTPVLNLEEVSADIDRIVQSIRKQAQEELSPPEDSLNVSE